MVTPEYARAYIDEITRYAHAGTTPTPRFTIGRLLSRLSR